MDTEYQSKMSFLIERAKTTPRSNPPHRRGESIDDMDLWSSAYNNQTHIMKMMPHAPRHVQLELAEKDTFSEYWGNDGLDAFKAYKPPVSKSAESKPVKTAPTEAVVFIGASASPAPNGRMDLVQTRLPASDTPVSSNQSSLLRAPKGPKAERNGNQQTSASSYHGVAFSRRSVVPASFQPMQDNGQRVATQSAQLHTRTEGNNALPSSVQADTVYAQILSLAESFHARTYKAKHGTYPPGYDKANATRKYATPINLRNTREDAFVFRHPDAYKLTWGTEICLYDQVHNFLARPYGTKIASLFKDGVGLLWIEFKTDLTSPKLQGVAAEYKGLLNGLSLYHQRDTSHKLPSLADFYVIGTNQHLFQPLDARSPLSMRPQLQQQAAPRTFERAPGERGSGGRASWRRTRSRSRSPSQDYRRPESYRDRDSAEKQSQRVKEEEKLHKDVATKRDEEYLCWRR